MRDTPRARQATRAPAHQATRASGSGPACRPAPPWPRTRLLSRTCPFPSASSGCAPSPARSIPTPVPLEPLAPSAPLRSKPLVRGQLSELCAVFYKNNLVYFSLTWGFIFKGYFELSRRGKSGEKTLHNSSS